jgi:hypothetical protein
MYGLPQAGIIAQELLEEQLRKAGYNQSLITPGYWTDDWRPISFALIVDNFGVKYIEDTHVHHLIKTLKADYKIDEDWKGERYLGPIDWDYTKREVHLTKPGYVDKALWQDSTTKHLRSLNINPMSIPSPFLTQPYNTPKRKTQPNSYQRKTKKSSNKY